MNAIIHIDEIFLKGSNQPFFYRQLKNNLEKLLSGTTAKRTEGGVWLENTKADELSRLSLIPGIANFAEAIKTKPTMENIKKGVDEIIGFSSRDMSPQATGGGSLPADKAISFRISAHRSFKNFPISSLEIEKQIGEWARLKYGWQVNLKHPDFNIHILVAKDAAYIYGNTRAGAGGLPTGVSGKVLTLLSGGIDSPVAAYKIMCRGGEIGLIHFQNQTQTAEAASGKIFDLAKTLARYQPEIKLFIVSFANIQKQIIINAPAPYRMIITRRIFNKIADKVAHQNNCLALTTGDSLGQVASQTLENMTAIYAASDMLKLSPLMGMNKKDIIDIARKIETFDISARPYEDCCSLFVAKHPETKAKLNDVLRYEENIDSSIVDKTPIISYRISANLTKYAQRNNF